VYNKNIKKYNIEVKMTRLTFANIRPTRVFDSSGYALYYTAGNVGIGTNNPTSTLEVSGNVNIDRGLLFVDASNNRIGVGKTNPSVALDVSGIVSVSGTTSLTGNVGIGRSSNTSALDVSGTALVSGRVGIGMTNPSVALDVSGVIRQSSFIAFMARSTGSTYASNGTLLGNNLYPTIVYNFGNCWNGNQNGSNGGRFTPTVSGYYNVYATLHGTNIDYGITIRKNGSDSDLYASVSGGYNNANAIMVASGIVYLNGTTDYIDFMARRGGAQAVSNLSTTGIQTFISAYLVAPTSSA
jgi:hypothetical protein